MKVVDGSELKLPRNRDSKYSNWVRLVKVPQSGFRSARSERMSLPLQSAFFGLSATTGGIDRKREPGTDLTDGQASSQLAVANSPLTTTG